MHIQGYQTKAMIQLQSGNNIHAPVKEVLNLIPDNA